MKLDKGYIQVYTGNGKGKTTAAIGQSIRAIGNDLKVYFVQFMKDFAYSELNVLKNMAPDLVLKRYGTDDFVFSKTKPSQELIHEMQSGLEEALHVMQQKEYHVIVLDEILVSIYFKLFTEHEVLNFLKKKPDKTELILTGRYCPDSILEIADLVTNMNEVKHYYQKGVSARRGIES